MVSHGRENLLDATDIDIFSRCRSAWAARRTIRIFGLSVDGEWVATACGLLSGSTFALVAQTMASGPWRNCSPGIVVTASTMEWSVEAGVSYFDFTIGHQQPYKLELGASEGKLYEIYRATSARGAAASAARLLVGAGKDLARRNPHLYSAARRFRDGIRAGIRRYKRLSLDGNCEFYQALYALALRYLSRLIRREVNWMISGRKPAAAVFEQVYTERR
jgi:CelD/BcsL family acetyltransferase involved in cellulose biosynthesis